MVIWLLVLWSFRGAEIAPFCQQIRRGLEIHRSAGRFPVPCSPGSPLGDVKLPRAARQAGVSIETSCAIARDDQQEPARDFYSLTKEAARAARPRGRWLPGWTMRRGMPRGAR